MNVYELSTDADRFRILEFVRPEEEDQFVEHFRDAGPAQVHWVPPEVRLSTFPVDLRNNDLPDLAPFAPCYSAEALLALDETRLAQAGCLHKLSCRDGEYWLHETVLLPALNEELSDCVRVPGSAVVLSVKRFVLDESVLQGAYIFRLTHTPLARVLVTQEFKDRVERAKLAGFRFRQIWPIADPDNRFRRS
jgi:hypothetical protein